MHHNMSTISANSGAISDTIDASCLQLVQIVVPFQIRLMHHMSTISANSGAISDTIDASYVYNQCK